MITETRIREITRLHGELCGYLRLSLDNAIRIGELLTEQKDSLPHGDFSAWVDENLPFTDRTARNYMRLYRERDRLKTETVSVLTEGYRLLAEKTEGHFEEALRLSKTWISQAACILDSPNAPLEDVLSIQQAAGELGSEWAHFRLVIERRLGELASP
jgi:hypothetical protein